MLVLRLCVVFLICVNTILGQNKTLNQCVSLVDCEKKADNTSIHRKKITLLSTGINEFSKDATTQSLIPIYLKRAKSILLEANGDTGYTGEVILKVTHKPEYKQAQLKKVEEDLSFIENHLANCSPEQVKEFNELKGILQNSK
ncbi:signal peptide [Leptospira ellinghausenii]|uniref:Signal peptide n=1 Tax=Leptospira ellinghausenii TaxID=1917822 RepID=A0A2P2DI34_9LEPT|nr:signal peptide [Leptospira ellinghausenii]